MAVQLDTSVFHGKRHRPLILHVGDDVANLKTIEPTFDEAGLDVLQALEGNQAVECFRQHQPDLIIIDIDTATSVMERFGIIEKIRKLPSGEHTPVLLMVEPDDEGLMSRAFNEGATDFLTKPLNSSILSHRVRYMLRHKERIDGLRSRLGAAQDTECSNAQRQIHHLAYYDVVTGLPNRAQLHEQLRYTIKMARRDAARFALLFLDLDHFKQVNDTMGHDAGDMLLHQVAMRLMAVVRETDFVVPCADEEDAPFTVARLGGDEFVVLLGQINRAEDAARVAERIAQSVGEPYLLGDNSANVTTTIGISVYPADGVTEDELLKNADVAMYHAKESGRNGYQFYSRRIHEQALARFSLEKDLRAAIENEQLTLVYQPKLDIATGQLSGVEALIRWDHEKRGNVNPDDFIPLAEETGLILPLGRWVMREACQQMQRWIHDGMPPLSIAVNCSSVQFTRSNMVEDVKMALESSGLNPWLFEVELTESLLLQDIEKGIKILQSMKMLGIQVAIDDFGAGFSSLSYLKRLPADKLKIDSVFVRNLGVDPGDLAIVSAIITLSHNLDLTVVAEGVETARQFDILKSFKCNEAQGFLISHPMKARDLERWVTDQGHSGMVALTGS